MRTPLLLNRIKPTMRQHQSIEHLWLVEDGVSSIWVDYDFSPPPAPEKSPQEKALDDFIAKRKAKRDEAKRLEESGAHTPYEQTTRENKRAADLDRAMSKLAPHEHTIHDRLMPAKVAL